MNLQFDPKSIRVLIVDDHAPIRHAIRRVIGTFNFAEILEASRASDALQCLERSHVDLVILDLFLAEKHGFDIIRFIRGRDLGSDLPILVVTGEASRDDIVKSSDLGANSYLLKPFKADQLTAKVTEILNQYYSPSTLVEDIRVAEAALFDKDYVAASKHADKALDRDGSSMRARHVKALSLIGLGQTNTAIAYLQKNIADNPSFFKNYRTLSDQYIKLGKKNEAIDALSKELDLNPKQPERQVKLAILYAKAKEFESSISHFREALKEDAKHADALMGMGKVHALAGNLDKAFYYFKRMRRSHPDSPKALDAMVKFALRAKEFKRAEIALKDERNANPRRLDTYFVLADLYLMKRNLPAALESIEQALKVDADNPTSRRRKADILLRLKRFDEAIPIYRRLITERPTVTLYAQLAKAYFGAEDYKQAMATYHRLRQTSHEPAITMIGLGEIYLRLDEINKAHYCFLLAQNEGHSSERLTNLLSKTKRVLSGRSSTKQRSAS